MSRDVRNQNCLSSRLVEGRGTIQARCSDESYYVGITRAGTGKRLSERATGTFAGYATTPRPAPLVWSQDFLNVTGAIALERRLKGRRRE